jgi:hypothetical protein
VDGKIKDQDPLSVEDFIIEINKDTIDGQKNNITTLYLENNLNMVQLKVNFRYLGSHFYELGVTYNTRI